MRIELDYQEIKEALAKAIEEKTRSMFGEILADDCYFTVTDSFGKEIHIGSLEFGLDVSE